MGNLSHVPKSFRSYICRDMAPAKKRETGIFLFAFGVALATLLHNTKG
jgi:hypothetical protein